MDMTWVGISSKDSGSLTREVWAQYSFSLFRVGAPKLWYPVVPVGSTQPDCRAVLLDLGLGPSNIRTQQGRRHSGAGLLARLMVQPFVQL